MSLIKTKSELHEQMVTWRHYIHKHPELSFKEEMTSDFIASVLESNNIEMHRGLAVTGIVATVHGTKKGKAIGLRADMDALLFKRGMSLVINLFMTERCTLVDMMDIQQCFSGLLFT